MDYGDMDHSHHNMDMNTVIGPTTASSRGGYNMSSTMGGPHAGHNMSSATMGPHAAHGAVSSNGQLHGMDSMKMYFHTDLTQRVLFYEWNITNVGGMVGSCIGIFLIALLYEGLKVYREHLLKKYNLHTRFSSFTLTNGQSSQESTTVMVDSPSHRRSHRFCSWPHFLQTFLHMVQVFISYVLMLIFMTYNIWLCLAVVLGAGTGYLVFGWRKAIVVDVNEHCH